MTRDFSMIITRGDEEREVKFYVGLTEYMVQNWPQGMEGCRLFRIEYGGWNELCVYEGTVWLPPHVDPDEFEDFLQDMFKNWNEQEYRRDNPDSGFLPPLEVNDE